MYQGGKSTFDTDRLNEIFRDEFDRAHYRVVGASGSLFADNSSAQGEYLLAGEVKQMHAEICYGGMSWDNPTADGEAFVEVKWEIYSALERKVVLERTTQGRRKIATARPGAEMEVFFDAFTLAMRDLAADRGLQDIVFNAEPDENADAGDEAGDQVAVQRFDVEIVPAAIVALVRVSGVAVKGLPVRRDSLDIGAEVYAVGSPIDPTLSATVSKGIVSAYRADNGIEWIQSDVTVMGGSSGGPLLDSSGNVVGITSRGLELVADIPAGINFFIPIEDGLRHLGIKLGGPLSTARQRGSCACFNGRASTRRR